MFELNLTKSWEIKFELLLRAGMGKVRPAGQIRPADAFGPACRVVNSTLASNFRRQIQTWSSYLLKSSARSCRNCFETATDKKKLPTPASGFPQPCHLTVLSPYPCQVFDPYLLDQAWATSGPRATYGPPSTLTWPASYVWNFLTNDFHVENMLKIQKNICFITKRTLKI